MSANFKIPFFPHIRVHPCYPWLINFRVSGKRSPLPLGISCEVEMINLLGRDSFWADASIF